MTRFSLSPETRRQSPIDGRGRDARGLCGLDYLPRVTDDEATELMVHHLQLAAIYYKNTPEDHNAVVVEVRRIVCRDLPPDFEGDVLVGAIAFLDAISKYHEKLKAEQSAEDDQS